MNDFQCVTLEKHSLLGHKLYQKTKTNEKADILLQTIYVKLLMLCANHRCFPFDCYYIEMV